MSSECLEQEFLSERDELAGKGVEDWHVLTGNICSTPPGWRRPQSLTQCRGHSPSRADSVVSSGHVASPRPLGWFLPVPIWHRKHEGESRNSFTVKTGGSSDFWRDYLHTDKLLMTNNARTHSRDSLYCIGPGKSRSNVIVTSIVDPPPPAFAESRAKRGRFVGQRTEL